jgi:hypothetical protein
LLLGCTPGGASFTPSTRDGGAPVDTPAADVAPPLACGDSDRDGLSDAIEGRDPTGAQHRDTDGDGTPDYLDTDSDDDGYFDQNEARRSYPMYASEPTRLTCGGVGDNCDAASGDALPNHLDPDSDNDGLTDHEELLARTDPCRADTDGDGATDLIEAAAMSDGRDARAQPPENTLYVVLPYHPPGETGMRERREFEFQTRIRRADVFFLVDNSASMSGTIAALRTAFTGTIVPGIQAQIPDLRVGVGSFDSMPVPPQGNPGMPGDYTLWVRQSLTDNVAAAQAAFNTMNTIDTDAPGFFGGDGPENSTEAAYEVVEGQGNRGHETDPAALRAVRNARDPMGNGWVPRVSPERDCAADAEHTRYGWGCFEEGRVPVVVLTSDADWYDGCAQNVPITPGAPNPGHNCDEMVEAYTRRGAFFLGIDVGGGRTGQTYANAEIAAMRTMTLDGMNRPIVFGPGFNGISGIAMDIMNAIAEIAGRSRQNITTRTVPDRAAEGLPAGRTTTDFIKSVTTVRAMPEAPEGYDRRDETTFYRVSPAARVVFAADFENDFMEGAATAKLFRATIEVLGRGNTVVDTRPVYIVVPARSSGLIPM